MKLELKHFSSYLPYGLTLSGFSSKLEPHMLERWIDGEWDLVPYLLPLSALTEPMQDGSVPAIKLAELLIEKGIKKDIATTIPFIAKIVTKPFGKMLKVTKCEEWYLMLSFDEPERVQHVIFEKLCEWHFDVYGLIDAGLAIDKRTIK